MNLLPENRFLLWIVVLCLAAAFLIVRPFHKLWLRLKP